MPLSVYAAGLGKLNVNSSLGEPFKAEIDLISTTPEELETLVAVVASEEAYSAQGITRLGIHNDIKVEIINAKSGQPKIKLSSNQAVTDPYVDMLIQLDWASGRLQREYTVLLDPPDFKQTIKNQEVADIAAPESLPAPVALDKPNAVEKTPQAADFPAEGVDAPDVDAEIKDLKEKSSPAKVKRSNPTQRKTKSGDSLSKIANSMRVDGVSLDQMLVALYEQNKDAFVGENMNRLKVGKLIKLPSKETLLATGKSEASNTVKTHVADWNAYRTNLAGVATEAKNTQTEQNNQSDSGKIAPSEPAPPPSPTGGQDVVKLSAGDKDKSSKDAKKAEEAKKIAEQEDKVAHDKALAEAQEKTVAVEKQIEDMQKLLELKNKSMAEMQKKAEADSASKDKAPQVTPEANTEEAKAPASSDNSEAVEPKEPVKPEVSHEEVKPTPPPKPVVAEKPVAPAAEEPSFFDSILQSISLPLLAGVAGVGLLGAGWVYLRNKRRKDLESFERGILTSGGLRANTVFGNTTGNTSTTDTSFLTDFAQNTDGSMMDTNDVDPIAEAEVYMAYGRDAQAEEILKDAIVKEPKRYELHLKLLEMYATRKDTSAFEAIAGELYTTLGSDDPTWKKVAEMGKGIEPNNPLYSSAATAKVDDIPVATEKFVATPNQNLSEPNKSLEDAIAPTVALAATTLTAPIVNGGSRIESIVKHERVEAPIVEDVQTDEDVKIEAPTLEETKSENYSAQPESVITLSEPDDLTLAESQDEVSINQVFESTNIEDISYDTDLEVIEDNQYEVSQSEMTVADLNFDLSQETDQDAKVERLEKPTESNLKSFDLSSISLDLDNPATELTIDSPEPAPKTATNNAMSVDANDVEVKLNLVAAYIDMDDKEGARELLEEVMKEGSEEQIMRAQMMLDSIS